MKQLFDFYETDYRLFAKTAQSFVVRLGLNHAVLDLVTQKLGWHQGKTKLLFPNGTKSLAEILWFVSDSDPKDPNVITGLKDRKIREKIEFLINEKIDLFCEDQECASRILGRLLLPDMIFSFKEGVWRSADTIWRLCGDQALDENHYSKRLIVSLIITEALVCRLKDGKLAQQSHISTRIGQVMAFEKFKSKLPKAPEVYLLEAFSGLAKLLKELKSAQFC